jgi:hypothetical protein
VNGGGMQPVGNRIYRRKRLTLGLDFRHGI